MNGNAWAAQVIVLHILFGAPLKTSGFAWSLCNMFGKHGCDSKTPLELMLEVASAGGVGPDDCLRNIRLGKGCSGRSKRDFDFSADPASYLDQMIAYLIFYLPRLISEAVEQSEAEIEFALIKKRTMGWSIVVGSWLDVAGEWIQNNRTLADFGGVTTLYLYGFLTFYGLGFGQPLLLGLPVNTLDCGPNDFIQVLREYGLSEPSPVQSLVRRLGVETARSVISEFETFVRLKLSCVLDREDNTEEAADVAWALDELVKAFNLRLDLPEEHGKVTPRPGSKTPKN